MNETDDSFQEARVYINGSLAGIREQHVSLLDRGFLYGDSAYEVTILKNGKYLFLEEHLARLRRSVDYLEFPETQAAFEQMKIFFEQLPSEIDSTITHYVRVILTRGIGPISLGNQLGCIPQWYALVRPLPTNNDWILEKGVRVEISTIMRNNKESVDPNCKSGNYLNNILCHQRALKNGKFEGIMLNRHGELTEGTTHNLWFFDGKTIKTPALECGLLAGITRAKLLSFCRDNAIAVEEGRYAAEALLTAKQAFLTSSTKAIVPIAACDERSYEIGPQTPCGKLQKNFWKHVMGPLES